jgi:hypothetical protein
MDIIFPSVLDFKTLCPKKLVFLLYNAIDTDQGNPFEVAVLLSKAYFILAGEKSFFRAYRC